MRMSLWNVQIRHLSMTPSQRTTFGVQVATKQNLEKDAVKLARALYTAGWWEENIITEVTRIGELWAAEELKVPPED